MHVRRCILAGVLVGVVASHATAQPRPLTLDDLYDPATRVNFGGTPPPPLSWIDATHYALPRQIGDAPDWVSVDAASGVATTLFQSARLEQALVASGLSSRPGAAGGTSAIRHVQSIVFRGGVHRRRTTCTSTASRPTGSCG